jgi:D-psicose/D-tagatose/L-ribulose 3-epimerase
MMIFCAHTFLFSFPFTDNSITVFRTIREIGFQAVEMSFGGPGDFDPKRVQRGLRDSGLSCCALCGLLAPDMDLRGSPEEQKNAGGFIRTCIDTCAELECDLLSGPLYSRVGRTDPTTREQRREQLKVVAGNLTKLCRYAEGKGVRLAVEPLIRFETDLINTCAEALELIELVDHPGLGVHLDTFHMNTEETNPSLAIVQARGRLFHVHGADNHRGAPGSGSFDWKGFRDALRFIGYDGAVVLESFHPDVPQISYAAAVRRKTAPSNLELARRGLRFLEALFAS